MLCNCVLTSKHINDVVIYYENNVQCLRIECSCAYSNSLSCISFAVLNNDLQLLKAFFKHGISVLKMIRVKREFIERRLRIEICGVRFVGTVQPVLAWKNGH